MNSIFNKDNFAFELTSKGVDFFYFDVPVSGFTNSGHRSTRISRINQNYATAIKIKLKAFSDGIVPTQVANAIINRLEIIRPLAEEKGITLPHGKTLRKEITASLNVIPKSFRKNDKD